MAKKRSHLTRNDPIALNQYWYFGVVYHVHSVCIYIAKSCWLLWFECSVHVSDGFQKKNVWMGLSSIQFVWDFWNLFNFAKPLTVQWIGITLQLSGQNKWILIQSCLFCVWCSSWGYGAPRRLHRETLLYEQETTASDKKEEQEALTTQTDVVVVFSLPSELPLHRPHC